MARPKEFDHDEAVRSAIALFQRKGYEATSVRDLLDALGVSSSSLYATFGGKGQLFMAALEAHAVGEREQLKQALGGPGSIGEKFERLFEQLIDGLTSPGGVGSLTLRAAIEQAGAMPEVLEFLSAYIEELIAMVTELIAEAQARGEAGSRHAPGHLARFLLLSAFNLGFVAKVTTRRETLEGYAAIALSTLEDHYRLTEPTT